MSAQPPTPTAVQAPSTGRDFLRVALLGLNAWVVVVLIPSWHVGIASAVQGVIALAPLLLLALGVTARRRTDWARWILLAIFPASIGAVVALRRELTDHDAYGALGMGLAALSMLAFVAAAAHALTNDRQGRTAETQPLVGKEPAIEAAGPRWTRRVLLAMASVGAFVVAVVAPALVDRRERVAIWGEASDDAAVLTVVVAALVASVALGTIVGPGLRAQKPTRERAGERGRRFAVALLLAIAAGAGWIVLARLDGR